MTAYLRLIVVITLLLGQAVLAPGMLAEATLPGVDDASDEQSDAAAGGGLGAATSSTPPDIDDLETALSDAAPALDTLGDVTWGVVTMLVPPVSYKRATESDLLENDVRQAIYETVVASPGNYVAGITEETTVATSTVRYHLRVLEKEGLVQSEKFRGKRRFYPAQSDDSAVAAAFNDEPSSSLVRTVADREPVRVSDLAAAVDRVPSTVSYHLSRLEADGVIVRERNGESVLVSLTPLAHATLDDRRRRSLEHDTGGR